MRQKQIQTGGGDEQRTLAKGNRIWVMFSFSLLHFCILLDEVIINLACMCGNTGSNQDKLMNNLDFTKILECKRICRLFHLCMEHLLVRCCFQTVFSNDNIILEHRSDSVTRLSVVKELCQTNRKYIVSEETKISNLTLKVLNNLGVGTITS